MIIQNRRYTTLDLLKIPFRTTPWFSAIAGAQILLAGLVPTLQIVASAYFIDTALSILKGNSHIGSVYPSLFAVVGLIAYMWISKALSKFAQVKMEIVLREKFRVSLVEKRARLAYEHIENQETWDLISRISKNPENQLQAGFVDLLSFLSKLVQIMGVLFLLFSHIWWATLLILSFSIPLFVLAVKSGRANYQADREVSKYNRKYEYLSEVLTGRETVDERSLFGFSGKVNETWQRFYDTARIIEFKTELKWFIKMKLGSLITALISVMVALVLLFPVLSGGITIGLFISLVNAVFGLVQMMSWELTSNVDKLAQHREYLRDLTDFSALDELAGATEAPVFPPPAFQTLEFKKVKFKYPGSQEYTLDGMSFQLTAGRSYAFVGANGAGKTTIIKLITGLYRNFEGEILINGKKIQEYRQSDLKALCSIVYQDYAKYYISMKDNIFVGNMNGSRDAELSKRLQKVIDQMGLNKVESSLPRGGDTPLGKIKEGGQDLSGGEWQRLAMARGLFNPAPLLILDEPTSALDPLSESKLYEEFNRISQNRTTIFISHRLGATKLADEIFVISGGQVIENGNHRELMSLRGDYAEMYESQKGWYQS